MEDWRQLIHYNNTDFWFDDIKHCWWSRGNWNPNYTLSAMLPHGIVKDKELNKFLSILYDRKLKIRKIKNKLNKILTI